ncbi:hypothetical protein AB0C02_27895 [Micromonospora sp. NPDC048999]|uniref:hypothetical protein n=1 Tax=Micromonospora sp. NPDC048999 TaxID=3155391 RepID=UPI0033DEE4B0
MIAVAILLIAGGAACIGWLLWEFARAPEQREPRPKPLTVDEHAQAPLLQPNQPMFTAAEEQQIADHDPERREALAAEWRNFIASLPDTHERKYRA